MVARVRPTDQTLETVLNLLGQAREDGLWPRGPRDLWTDALGVILLLSLRRRLFSDHHHSYFFFLLSLSFFFFQKFVCAEERR